MNQILIFLCYLITNIKKINIKKVLFCSVVPKAFNQIKKIFYQNLKIKIYELKDLDLIRKIEKDGYKLQNFNLKNPDHVYALHILVKAIGIKDTSLEKLLLLHDPHKGHSLILHLGNFQGSPCIIT